MSDFEIFYPRLQQAEGLFADNVADKGGVTYAGISHSANPGWEGWTTVTAAINALQLTRPVAYPNWARVNAYLRANAALRESVKAYYKVNYWDSLHLDQVRSQAIANEVADTGVNMGIGRAATFLQRAINVTNNVGRYGNDVTVDGRIGPATLTALNNHSRPDLILKAMNILQGALYIQLAEANRSQEQFIQSWFSRVALT